MLKVGSIEQMEEQYTNRFREIRHQDFVSDYPIIKDKIDTFTNSIKKYASIHGGKKRKYSIKKRKLLNLQKKNRTRY